MRGSQVEGTQVSPPDYIPTPVHCGIKQELTLEADPPPPRLFSNLPLGGSIRRQGPLIRIKTPPPHAGFGMVSPARSPNGAIPTRRRPRGADKRDNPKIPPRGDTNPRGERQGRVEPSGRDGEGGRPAAPQAPPGDTSHRARRRGGMDSTTAGP